MLDLETTSDASSRSARSARTLGAHLDSRLSRVLRSLGQGQHLGRARKTVALLTRSWRDEPASAGPRWPSDITDDHSPFEFSLALDGVSSTLRILTEPQDPRQPSLTNSWRLGEEIHEELAVHWGAGLSGYRKISDLFRPRANDTGVFSVWHSAILGSRENLGFKIYLNPALRGVLEAPELVSEALARLGLGEAWKRLVQAIGARGSLDRILYFSLDLADHDDARAKVYVAHHHATTQDLARVLGCSPGFEAAKVDGWCRHLMGGSGPFSNRPPITCFAFGRGNVDLRTTTLHLPVRCYLGDDLDIARRVCVLLPFHRRVDYLRALAEFVERPLEAGPGLQTYVSLRASPGREAVTVYCAPQLYASVTPSADVSPFSLFPPGEKAYGATYPRHVAA